MGLYCLLTSHFELCFTPQGPGFTSRRNKSGLERPRWNTFSGAQTAHCTTFVGFMRARRLGDDYSDVNFFFFYLSNVFISKDRAHTFVKCKRDVNFVAIIASPICDVSREVTASFFNCCFTFDIQVYFVSRSDLIVLILSNAMDRFGRSWNYNYSYNGYKV